MHNVVHVVFDDLRSELGAYGANGAVTPTLDKLAASGTVFDRAYAQQAVCGPSRNSFLSGRRPDKSRSWNFINHFREDHPEWTSLPGVFLSAGVAALGAGKLYHPKLPPEYDGNRSWSDEALPYRNPCWNTASYPATFPKFQDGGLPCVPCATDIEHYILHTNSTVANDWCELDAGEDTLSVEMALHQLRAAAGAGRQFYLAVGLHKPHLPWQASAADFAAHPLDGVEPARYLFPPTGVPGIALQDSDSKDPFTPLPNASARAARRAYRAAITGAGPGSLEPNPRLRLSSRPLAARRCRVAPRHSCVTRRPRGT